MTNDSGLLETIDDLTAEIRISYTTKQELINALNMAVLQLEWFAPKEPATHNIKKTLLKYMPKDKLLSKEISFDQ